MARGSKARSRGAAVAATLAAPFLLYLIARMIPAPLPPLDPMLAARQEMVRAIVPTHRIGADGVATARRAALSSPLAFEPAFLLARAAEQRGDLAGATGLMEEVRRRRANFVPARLQLAVYYGAAARFPEMFAEIDVALRLNAEARQAVVQELTRLIAMPDAREALADALARNPSWRSDFFAAAHGRSFTPADTLALYEAVRARNPAFRPALEYRLYLESLIRTGQVARARQLWLRSLPAELRARSQTLFDGGFTGAAAIPPFGWTLAQSELGRAEIVREGRPHLAVDYFGGRSQVLAEQIVALAPGRWQLRFAMRSDEGVSRAHIFWVVACYPSGALIDRSEVERLGQDYRRGSMAFTVPANCSGQVLRLVGEPGDISVPVSFQVGSVEVTR